MFPDDEGWVMQLEQESHRSDAVLFSVPHIGRRLVPTCPITKDVKLYHLL